MRKGQVNPGSTPFAWSKACVLMSGSQPGSQGGAGGGRREPAWWLGRGASCLCVEGGAGFGLGYFSSLLLTFTLDQRKAFSLEAMSLEW